LIREEGTVKRVIDGQGLRF